MVRKRLYLICVVALLVMSVNAIAVNVVVPVTNGGFEQPATGKIKGWDGVCADPAWAGSKADVPGWSSDFAAFDSGVEGMPKPPPHPLDVGDYYGVLLNNNSVWGGQADPSIWQVTDYTIGAGDKFTLKVDSADLFLAPGGWFGGIPDTVAQLQMSLFYVNDAGARVALATQTVTLGATEKWKQYSLDADGAAGVGHKLGIELYNITDLGGQPVVLPDWLGVDDVRIVPEPATMVLLGLGSLALLKRRKS
jgi:hypothetical protein